MKRRPRIDDEARQKDQQSKKQKTISALGVYGNVWRACKASKINRSTHYLWLESDPLYAKAAKDAMDEAADRLEEEARRRASIGVLRPIYQQGVKVGAIREYSDTLLIFLLNGLRPEKYKRRVEHTGEVKRPITIDLSNMTDEEIETIDTIFRKAASRKEPAPASRLPAGHLN